LRVQKFLQVCSFSPKREVDLGVSGKGSLFHQEASLLSSVPFLYLSGIKFNFLDSGKSSFFSLFHVFPRDLRSSDQRDLRRVPGSSLKERLLNLRVRTPSKEAFLLEDKSWMDP